MNNEESEDFKSQKINKQNPNQFNEEDNKEKNINKISENEDNSSNESEEEEKKKKKKHQQDSENEEEKKTKSKKKSKKKSQKKGQETNSDDEESEGKHHKKKKKKKKKEDSSSNSGDLSSSSEDSYEQYLKWKKKQKQKKNKDKGKKKNKKETQTGTSGEEEEERGESDSKENSSYEEGMTNKPISKKKNKEKEINCFAAPSQIDLTPNTDDSDNSHIITLIGEYLKVFLKFGSFFPEFRKNENHNFIKKFISKYSMFFGIKRFSIPVFGTISCGKSSFLNYLLKLHKILETHEDIATKFVCFIRHVKGLKKPKVYNVQFEMRDTGKFNFEKGYELKRDVKTIIKERNRFIREGKGKRDPSNYFLIIESDIPLFHGENEKYAPFFEFLDFPGLDEVKSGEKSINENTYFKDFLPLVQPNIMFSLFLFDLNSYESTSGKEIFKYYIFNENDCLSKILKKSLYNSVYILNQIDKELKLEKDKDKRILVKENRDNHFRGTMKENFEKILNIKDFIFNNNNSISLSAKILELEEYKLESFPKFIEYIISLEDIEEEKNFKFYLEKKLREILNINAIDKTKKKNVI